MNSPSMSLNAEAYAKGKGFCLFGFFYPGEIETVQLRNASLHLIQVWVKLIVTVLPTLSLEGGILLILENSNCPTPPRLSVFIVLLSLSSFC